MATSKPFRFCKRQPGCAKHKTSCCYMKLDNRHTDHRSSSNLKHAQTPLRFCMTMFFGLKLNSRIPPPATPGSLLERGLRLPCGHIASYCLMIDCYCDPIPRFPVQQHMRERCIKHVGCDSTSKGLLRKTLVALSSEKDGHCPHLKHQQRKLKRIRLFLAAQPISSNFARLIWLV